MAEPGFSTHILIVAGAVVVLAVVSYIMMSEIKKLKGEILEIQNNVGQQTKVTQDMANIVFSQCNVPQKTVRFEGLNDIDSSEEDFDNSIIEDESDEESDEESQSLPTTTSSHQELDATMITLEENKS